MTRGGNGFSLKVALLLDLGSEIPPRGRNDNEFGLVLFYCPMHGKSMRFIPLFSDIRDRLRDSSTSLAPVRATNR